MKNFRKGLSDSKRGMFALEQLIGILLSAMVLVMIFMYFIVPFFFATSTNLKIAKSNANSIKDFIDMSSSGEYSNLEDCYSVLKVNNLENFQFSEKNKDTDNYFYVLGPNRVYVIPFKYINKIDEARSVGSLAKYKSDEYDSGAINIVYDKTNQGGKISGDIEFIPGVSVSFGKTGNKLEIEDKGDYIILEPEVTEKAVMSDKVKETFSSKYSQNMLSSKMYFKDKITIKEGSDDYDFAKGSIIGHTGDSDSGSIELSMLNIKGDKIIFKSDDREVFVSGGDFSNLIIDNFLCSFMYLNKEDRFDHYRRNIGEVPLSNMKIVASFVFNDGGESDYFFEYVGDEVKCFYQKDEGCKSSLNSQELKEVLDEAMISDNPEEFKSNLESFYSKVVKKEGTMRTDLVELTEEEKREIELDVDFEDVFDRLEGYEDGFSEEDRNTFVFSLNDWLGFNNIEFNGREDKYSNRVTYKNGNAYFYVRDDKIGSPEYYSFDENWLSKEMRADKEGIDFYFKGEKIEDVDKREIKVDDAGWFKFDDSSNFYILEIEGIDGKSYDIVLSPPQVNKMSNVKNG